MPPIPERVLTSEGVEIFGPGQIQTGENVWQALRGMEVGSVWGHGSYMAPDWTAWAAAANRPGQDISCTHNWPHEPLVGNRATGESVMWTGVSIIMLLAGICARVWWYAARRQEPEALTPPPADPLQDWMPFPSQRALLKYFRVVAALVLVQILMGVFTVHYGVEGEDFYNISLAKWLPYSVTRTWHIQLGIF